MFELDFRKTVVEVKYGKYLHHIQHSEFVKIYAETLNFSKFALLKYSFEDLSIKLLA